MNYQDIRLSTIEKLKNVNADCVISLPTIDYVAQTRTKENICNRINVMHLLYTISVEPENKAHYIDTIKRNLLGKYLSGKEIELLNHQQLSGDTILRFEWYKESIKALLWSISLIPTLDIPVTEDFLSKYYHLMPPEISFESFIKKGEKRNYDELYSEADLLFCYHWCTRHFYDKEDKAIVTSIIRERRKALEWVIQPQYMWDDIALDT